MHTMLSQNLLHEKVSNGTKSCNKSQSQVYWHSTLMRMKMNIWAKICSQIYSRCNSLFKVKMVHDPILSTLANYQMFYCNI